MLRRIWDNLPVVTRNLVAINVVVWLLCAVVDRISVMGYGLTELWLGMWNASYAAFQGAGTFHVWQPLTYMFMHANFSHLFFNMFSLLMFGPVIEREWGEKKYLTYYLVCGVGAAIVQQLTWMIDPGLAVTIGASGAVFGILFAFAWLFPEQRMFLLFIPIPIPSRIFVAIFAVLELLAGVSSSGDGVAHFAHLGGMLFGFLLILYWKKRDEHNDKNGRFKVYEGKDFSGYHYQDPV